MKVYIHLKLCDAIHYSLPDLKFIRLSTFAVACSVAGKFMGFMGFLSLYYHGINMLVNAGHVRLSNSNCCAIYQTLSRLDTQYIISHTIYIHVYVYVYVYVNVNAYIYVHRKALPWTSRIMVCLINKLSCRYGRTVNVWKTCGNSISIHVRKYPLVDNECRTKVWQYNTLQP